MKSLNTILKYILTHKPFLESDIASYKHITTFIIGLIIELFL